MVRQFVPLVAALLAAVAAGCDTGDDDDSAVPAFSLTNLTIEEHPNSVLIAMVRWTTDVPASSRVEHGPGSQPAYFVQDDALVTEHELVVVGLAADTESRIEAISIDTSGAEVRSPVQTWTPAELPFPSAATTLSTHHDERMQPGWTLSNLAVASSITRTVAVMFDAQGRIVWYHDMGDVAGTADVEVTWLEEGRVLIGGSIPELMTPIEVDLEGNVLWEGPLQPEGIAQIGSMHHAMKKLPGGTYVTIFHDHLDGDSWVHDRVDEFTADLETVWSWSAAGVPDHGSDYLQGNMVEIDVDEDVMYYNSRFTSTLYKVDRSSGEVLWRLGESGDFEMTTDHEEPWFGRAHAPDILPDGHVLLYDNGQAQRGYSRLVEYALDESSMTASIAWEYDGSASGDEWVTTALGDVDRLANGNTLACAGSMYGDDTQSRIIEVDAGGELVWELYLRSAEDEDDRASCYMVQRIPIPVDVL